MGAKLSSRQQAQVQFLEMLPPKFARVHNVIEQIGNGQADEAVVRGLARQLDGIKSQAGGLSLNALADTAGLMGTMARRGSSGQMKARGLRELFGSLKINFESALKRASTPATAEDAASDAAGGGAGPAA